MFCDVYVDEVDICVSVDVFFDEFIVWRELAVNFVLRNLKYDFYDGFFEWVWEMLERYWGDCCEWMYIFEEFEYGWMYDKLWNVL